MNGLTDNGETPLTSSGLGEKKMIEDKLLNCIVQRKDELETPLYMYSAEQLDLAAEQLLTIFPERVRLFYSLKANPQPLEKVHDTREGQWPVAAVSNYPIPRLDTLGTEGSSTPG